MTMGYNTTQSFDAYFYPLFAVEINSCSCSNLMLDIKMVRCCYVYLHCFHAA